MIIYLTVHRDANLIGYNLDLERLKETFFSPPKKKFQKKKKKFSKKRFYLITFLIFFILIVFLLNYNLIIIPNNIKKTSIINKNSLKIYIADEFDNIKFRKTKFPVFFILPLNTNTKLYLDFKNTINLKDKNLLIHLKKQIYPLKIYVIIRDNNFVSNVSSPISIELESKKDYIVPINFKNLEEIDLSKINQIRLIFYSLELQQPITEKKIEKNYIILKDIFFG